LEEMDTLIAASAEHLGLKLATINVKHFSMLKGLRKAY
jgi:predicted nucleic acid-binding protein